ncbi:MAG: hypothetical protein KY475_18355 [Planctomycetes bacterium]|nr:hypothetical protein [Planctomycetota bacterium]
MREKLIFLLLAVLFCGLLAHRIWRSARLDPAAHAMPQHAFTDDEERALYFTPAGAYTEADIAANGDATPSARYRGFRARHDFNPQPGDPLCPITRTKANPQCTWIIGGREYEFCCPPCIDEFVRLAKEQPDAIAPPEEYLAR